MAKILVADDNSNIQKMVGLALKDQGIDVVAVGNGEAAVRKISDVRPDLVLADVFMPVRNGYEVCQFVKTDSSLAHIPVILLVGAFDPLDEQEAQRVGADGVLKKPFVPPDPLISMVKSALQRAGVSTEPMGSAKSEQPEPLRAADLLTPSNATVPTIRATPVEHEEFMPTATEESFGEEEHSRPQPVRIDSRAPVAFGSLLETPTAEAEDDSFVSSVPPDYAGDRDWRAKDEEESEEEEEDKKPAAWRSDQADSYAGPGPEKNKGSKDWRSGGFEQIARGKSRGGWEPEEEKPEAVEAVPASSNSVVVPPPPTPAEQPAPVAASPFGSDPWASASKTLGIPKPEPSIKTATVVEEAAQPVVLSPSSATAAPPANTEPAPAEPEKKEESWFSTPTSPWDAEMQKASQLASTWDTPVEPRPKAASENGTDATKEGLSEETQAVIEQATLPPATVEAIREEAALVTEDIREESAVVAEDATTEETEPPIYRSSYVAGVEDLETAPDANDPPSPSMDDLVAKVLSKMSPDVLQAVTREILKPVVEAMVKEELKSKKPVRPQEDSSST